MSYACYHRSTAVILLLNIYWLKAKSRCKLGNWESIWKFFRKRKFSLILLYGLPTFFDLLDCCNFFQVSFGFVIISAIEIICSKYFQLRKIANRTKCNTFFGIRKCIPNPRYTRLKFLANMSYGCYHRSTTVILLFKYILT